MNAAIVCHLFYPEEAEKLIARLQAISSEDTRFFINIQESNERSKELIQFVRQRLPQALVLTAPNKGRDIGAKLMLIDLQLQLGVPTEYTLIIHDKKSPHLGDGARWREELFRIVDTGKLEQVFRVFARQPEVGIICSAAYIQNEFNEVDGRFSSSCNHQLLELMERYNIRTSDYNFVAGNIFWIRTQLLVQFFSQRPLLQIRSDLEQGNALDFTRGTYIHSWERLMSWIATSQGYTIYGI